MTLTSKTMEWLNHNRHRSYPMKRDEWREKASPTSGLDCILLDATLFDPDAKGDESLIVSRVKVAESSTRIAFIYGGRMFGVVLSGGEEIGDGSFERVRGVVEGSGARGASVSLVFSSHAYIRSVVGDGEWKLDSPVLDSRVVLVSDGIGVDGISVNGSEGVSGHDSASKASGDVVLEDGYRTSPVIFGGNVRSCRTEIRIQSVQVRLRGCRIEGLQAPAFLLLRTERREQRKHRFARRKGRQRFTGKKLHRNGCEIQVQRNDHTVRRDSRRQGARRHLQSSGGFGIVTDRRMMLQFRPSKWYNIKYVKKRSEVLQQTPIPFR